MAETMDDEQTKRGGNADETRGGTTASTTEGDAGTAGSGGGAAVSTAGTASTSTEGRVEAFSTTETETIGGNAPQSSATPAAAKKDGGGNGGDAGKGDGQKQQADDTSQALGGELPEGDDGGIGLGFGAAMAALGEEKLNRVDSIESAGGDQVRTPGHLKERKPAKEDRRQSRRDSVNGGRRESMRASMSGRRDSVGRILGPDSGRRVSISLKKRLQAVMGVPSAAVADSASEESGKHNDDGGGAGHGEKKRGVTIVEDNNRGGDMANGGNGGDSASEPSTSTHASRRGSESGLTRGAGGSVDGDDRRSMDDRTSVGSGNEDESGFTSPEPYSGRKQVMVKKRESQTPSMFDQAAGKVYENLHELKERLEYRQNCIMPESIFLLYWRKVVLCALIYCTIVVPYQVVFEDVSEFGFNYVTVGDMLVCALLSVDIVLNFFTAYETKDNVVVCKRQHIALNYANSWLLLDLCTTFPFDIILNTAAENQTLAKYLRLITLLRIARLTKMLHRNMKGKQITSIRRLINVLFMTLSLCHYNACFFYFIAQMEYIQRVTYEPITGEPQAVTRAGTWVRRYDPDGTVLKTATDKYIRSMYWSIVTLTTTGYGDIVPVTNWEAVWSVIMMLVGITVFSYLTGVIASAVSNSDSRQRYIHEQMASLQSMLDYRKIPGDLREHVESYYARHLQHEALADEERVLSKLPLSLRKDILMVIHGDTVLKAEIFKVPEISGQPAVVERIVATFSTLVYPPNLIVMNMNDLADGIYFIDKGFMEEFVKIDELLQIKSKKKKHAGKELHQTTRLLGPGKVYGEVGVTLHVVELLYLRSLTFCDVARLGRDDLHMIFDDFPPVADALREQAQKIRSRQELLVETLKSFARGEDREKWNRYKLARKRFQALTNTVQRALDSRLYSENEVMQFLTYSTLRPPIRSNKSVSAPHSGKGSVDSRPSGFGMSLFGRDRGMSSVVNSGAGGGAGAPGGSMKKG